MGNILDIEQPAFRVPKVVVTGVNSPDRADESNPGMMDPGEAHFVLLWKSADVATLYALLQVEGLLFRLVYNIGANVQRSQARWDFAGHLADFGRRRIEIEGAVGIDAAIQINGRPVFTPAM